MTGAPDPAELYERHAAGWDTDRAAARPHGESGWIDRFLKTVPATGEVLDLGCGSGAPIGVQIAESGRSLTGVDAAPSLIALSRTRLPGRTFHTADMRGLDLGRGFDGLVCWHALFHLPPEDHPAMFDVFARHLKPAATLIFTSGTEQGETIGTWRGEALYHASLDTAQYRALLDRQGFQVLDHVVEDPGCGGATIWLARRA